MNKKMKRSKVDKIIFGIFTLGTFFLFIFDKSTPFLKKFGLGELQPLIPFFCVLSFLTVIWSFIWDSKIIALNEKIEKHEETLSNEIEKSLGELKESVFSELSKPELTESRVLFESEIDLKKFLSLASDNSEFAQLYIITNDAGVENDDFGDAICLNIINDHRYVYMTPLSDEEFMQKLRETLFRTIPKDIDKYHLDAAIRKNIIHIQNAEFFDVLPEYSDMIVYTKTHLVDYSQPIGDTERGYYSFQNGAIIKEGVSTYFYKEMSHALTKRIISYINTLIEQNKINNLSFANYTSPSVEKRNDKYGGQSLFCVEKILKGDLILRKGGRFIEKSKLNKNLVNQLSYLQVSDKYVISSIAPLEDKKIGKFPINHSCQHSNCCLGSTIDIIASSDIEIDKEILLDYATFDPTYHGIFHCKECECCKRADKKPKQIVNEIERNQLAPYLSKRKVEELKL